MLLSLCRIVILFLISASFSAFSANVSTYLPDGASYDKTITTPESESALGFGIGERHPRHDQVLSYLTQVADSSSRVTIKEIGRTNQFSQS